MVYRLLILSMGTPMMKAEMENHGRFRVATIFGINRFGVANAAASFSGSNFIRVNTTLGNFGGDFTISTWYKTIDFCKH